MFCSYCESRIFDTDRTCPQCGAPTKNYIKVEKEEGKKPKRFLVSLAQVFFSDIDTLKVIADGTTNIDSGLSFTNAYPYNYYHDCSMSMKIIISSKNLHKIRFNDVYNVVLLAKIVEEGNLQNPKYTQIEIPRLKITQIHTTNKKEIIESEEWEELESVIEGIPEIIKGEDYSMNYYAKVLFNIDKIPGFIDDYIFDNNLP
jgi:hypothetical protein